MPAPNVTGGGVLQPINLTAPGFLGLNTDMGASILTPEWATLANNAVFDDNNRLAVRKGWVSQTTTAVTGDIKRIHEYWKADGTAEIIFSTDDDIYSGVTTPSSIDGTLTITDGNIKFSNFNDKCIAFGIGSSGNPAVYIGSGNFTSITVNSGTAPTGRVGNAIFGRLWVVDVDGKTIRYSALLDETRWSVADGGGTIDMSKVWVNGQDTIVAIGEFAGDLVIFGKNQIIFWSDGAGAALGVDPDNLYVSDTIPNLGLVSQFAITPVEGDLWFASQNGIQSLMRQRAERTTPMLPITENVSGEYSAFLRGQSEEEDITLAYSPKEQFCIVNFPAVGRQIVINSRPVQAPIGIVYKTTTWTSGLLTATYRPSNRDLLGSLEETEGELFLHNLNSDDDVAYSFSYESGWLDLGEQAAQYVKWVKKLTSVVFVEADTNVSYSLKYDFNTLARTHQAAAEGGPISEFNVSEFGANGSRDPDNANLVAGTDVSEYSGGITLRTLQIPGQGGGQYIKVGVSLNTNKRDFALQQINLFARIGRLANV